MSHKTECFPLSQNSCTLGDREQAIHRERASSPNNCSGDFTKPSDEQDFFGITSTIPIEIPLSAKKKIIDLNNLFITSNNPDKYVKLAEEKGYPRTCCTWIKGIYGYVLEKRISKIIFVTGGDCSNTHALRETLLPELKEVFTFSFPYPPDKEALKNEMEKLSTEFGTTILEAEEIGKKLFPIRKMLAELDRLTWEEGIVTGFENFKWLLSSSDFNGAPDKFEQQLAEFLSSVKRREPGVSKIRIGVLGVPPVFSDLHKTIEEIGGKIVFNEIPRQFAMLDLDLDLVSRYQKYSYPYGVWPRIKDINCQIEKRKIDGLIHYTQSFCYRQIHDILLRRMIKCPILTIEGENPSEIDQRTRLRIESFFEMLEGRHFKGT
ncbi:MAG: 2-hydroxyacyl-CoA dehydratase [Candidatus Riflebacteria bacterium]|nr:2-hydroxyacyl-CoA dehydratase [Candidatus Riflebacteria bacterium]